MVVVAPRIWRSPFTCPSGRLPVVTLNVARFHDGMVLHQTHPKSYAWGAGIARYGL